MSSCYFASQYHVGRSCFGGPRSQVVTGPIRVHNPQEALHDNASSAFDVVEDSLQAWTDRHETLAVEGIRSDKVKTKTGLHLDRFPVLFVGWARVFSRPAFRCLSAFSRTVKRLLGFWVIRPRQRVAQLDAMAVSQDATRQARLALFYLRAPADGSGSEVGG